jgi:hypothetical protein
VSDWLAVVLSDHGNDLGPSLVHRLEPLSLLLSILVRDGADEVVAPAVLVDLTWLADEGVSGAVPPESRKCFRQRLRCWRLVSQRR